MLENEFFGEQPNNTSTSTTAVDFENASLEGDNGSPFGKFKTAESLYEAYQNLHGEFTKKCQAYNQLIKKSESDNAKAPLYDDAWQKKVDDFLEIHPNAKAFSKEISEVLLSDKIGDNANSLEVAYSIVLERKNEELLKSLNNEQFIMSCITDKMKNKIINDYLKDVNNSSPFLMSSKGGSNIVSSYKKPANMQEAREMARKIFN